MAKVPFTKLKCRLNNDVVPCQIGEETIGVKQYLPIQNKLQLIEDVINQAYETDINYANPVKTEVYLLLEIVYAYTDISFTEKQKEEITKTYDLLCSSEALDKILEVIPEEEIETLYNGVRETTEALYKYQNSVLGIMNNLNNESGILGKNLNNIREQLLDPELLENVTKILSASGL